MIIHLSTSDPSEDRPIPGVTGSGLARNPDLLDPHPLLGGVKLQ